MEEDIEFRKGLPPDYLSNLGIAHSDQDTKPRRDFLTKVSSLMGKLVHYASVGKKACALRKYDHFTIKHSWTHIVVQFHDIFV